MKSGSKLSDVCKLQGIVRKECDVFLEPGSFHENIAAGCDVILMDKVCKPLLQAYLEYTTRSELALLTHSLYTCIKL